MSKTAPAIPFFGDAYLADTRHLSLEEHGAYLQLMMIAWRVEGCCLPDDDTRLARILGVTAAKWKKLKPSVMAFWTLESGFWIQGRLTKERNFVEEKRAKNKASADSRWGNQATENKGGDGMRTQCERNAPPPPPLLEEVSTNVDMSAEPTEKPLTADEVVEAWNDRMVPQGFPPVKRITDARRKHLRVRLRENTIDDWQQAMAALERSAFCRGENNTGWRADFDFLLQPKSFTKLLEGAYDH